MARIYLSDAFQVAVCALCYLTFDILSWAGKRVSRALRETSAKCYCDCPPPNPTYVNMELRCY
ncbi:hypothetical protein PLICRDRAFT_36751 [Plicaturopsis crispa FD-325 SS-3]|nr:hypothetical protein PLICRDRAFT_36751 [Plicaturopsis crispa FD-325 SS-3]